MTRHTPSVSTDYGTTRATLRGLNESFDELSCRIPCPGTLSTRGGVLVCERCNGHGLVRP